jgi:hypothetical protein
MSNGLHLVLPFVRAVIAWCDLWWEEHGVPDRDTSGRSFGVDFTPTGDAARPFTMA